MSSSFTVYCLSLPEVGEGRYQEVCTVFTQADRELLVTLLSQTARRTASFSNHTVTRTESPGCSTSGVWRPSGRATSDTCSVLTQTVSRGQSHLGALPLRYGDHPVVDLGEVSCATLTGRTFSPPGWRLRPEVACRRSSPSLTDGGQLHGDRSGPLLFRQELDGLASPDLMSGW